LHRQQHSSAGSLDIKLRQFIKLIPEKGQLSLTVYCDGCRIARSGAGYVLSHAGVVGGVGQPAVNFITTFLFVTGSRKYLQPNRMFAGNAIANTSKAPVFL